jgi:hypothetical protein
MCTSANHNKGFTSRHSYSLMIFAGTQAMHSDDLALFNKIKKKNPDTASHA